MKIHILINTFNRPDKFCDLIESIQKNSSKKYDLFLQIVEDRSYADYIGAVELLHKYNIEYKWLKMPVRFGKARYWKLMDLIYADIESYDFDYFIQVPDDVTLIEGFFDQAVYSYNIIEDPYCICLNLLSDSRAGSQMWTDVQPRKKIFEGVSFWLSGWMDMCIISDKRFLQALEYKINNVDQDWAENMQKSTGVGMQISQRLAKNYNLYQCVNSLVTHGIHASVMHPGEVKGCTNDITEKVPDLYSGFSKDYQAPDKITAGIASMPSRVECLHDAVISIIDQVDQLNVYLNEYLIVPDFLNHPKIKVFKSQNEEGDLGDAGKFYKVSENEGYYLSIDDDIIYPPNYVSTMIQNLDLYNRKVVITLHGRIFDNFPVVKYYKGHSKAFRCTDALFRDEFIHIPGTGVSCFHADMFKISIDDFEISNMADIWLGLICQNNKIPVLCIAHRAGYIKLNDNFDDTTSIYYHMNNNDKIQVDVMNRINEWKLYKSI